MTIAVGSKSGRGRMIRTMGAEPRSRSSRTLANARPRNDVPLEDRAVVRFVTFELFVVLYFEKIGVGPPKAQVILPLIVMFTGLVCMILTRRVTFSGPRLGLYLIFVGCCLLSTLLGNGIGSTPSIMELFLLYSFMTISARLSEAGYHRILDNFIKMMVLPAIIIIVQFGIQRITGGGDPILMNYVLPKWLLVKGYVYSANFPNWDSPFQRPNGFFFLEPSFASFFTASAVIIEAMFFRRIVLFILMLIATALTQGGTGIIMVVLASPFLLARESPRVVLPIVIIGIAGLVAAYFLGVSIPLISRLDELNTNNVGGGHSSSGALRLIIPWGYLIDFLSDPSYLFTGAGAGATRPEEGSPWPILKITHEYGVLSMISFVVFFTSGFVGSYNIPLKFAAWVVFNFTGGYLLDTAMVATFSILFCIVEPVRSRAGNELRVSITTSQPLLR